MNLIEKIKAIETYVCENFEELGLDDPVEEEYFSAYEEIKGASEKELQIFEEDYGVSLPEDWKELYRYKNGSGFFSMLPCVLGKGEYAFSLLSLEQIRRVKGYFQNRDALLTDFPDYFSKEDIERMADARLRPYLFHTKWFPFKLNEILEVQFVKFPIRGRWSLGGYVGELRVIKMNGHRCRWISFDGSVYYGHIVWITNEHIIDLSTDLLMKELRQHGVQCFKERNWCS